MTIRTQLVDFWAGFDTESDFLMQALRRAADIRLVDADADLVVYSAFGKAHAHPRHDGAVKLFCTHENVAPDFNACDYAISFEHLDFGDRHVRFPLVYAHDSSLTLAERPGVDRALLDGKTGFCNFIASNGRWVDPARDAFFHLLNRRKAVASSGRHLRNHPGLDAPGDHARRRDNKLRFQRQFRFSIAFENSSQPGYVTEKILDAFVARTIPIYWGDTRIAEEFNTAAFVNVRDFPSLEAVADHVLALDADPGRMLEMLNAPVFAGGMDWAKWHRDRLDRYLAAILAQPLSAARRRPRHGRWQATLEGDRRRKSWLGRLGIRRT